MKMSISNHLTPVTIALVKTQLGKSRFKKIRILLDSGSSGSIILEKFVRKLRMQKRHHHQLNHKNLTYKNFNTECIMRWQLLFEEFGHTIKYIKGPKNIVADALSRLNFVSLPSNVQDMADCYGLDKDESIYQPKNAFLITYQLINHGQQKDKTLLTTIKQGAKHYTLKEFHGGSRSS